MSRSFSLIVLCPNGRRETVKINSNDSILQVLEEACKKQSLNPEEFDLYHYKKSLDLSLPIRFANLPNNAFLELQPAKNTRKDCLVTIALQLESGERHTGDFSPSSNIFDILMHFLTLDFINIQGKKEPVCVYMRQQIAGDALKTTTLRSLGLMKGSAIIRLMFREPEQLDSQAHISIPLSSRSITRSVPSFATDSSKSMVENSAVTTNANVSSQSEYKSGYPPGEIPDKPQETVINNKRLIDEKNSFVIENEDSSMAKKSNINLKESTMLDCNVLDQNIEKCDVNANGKSDDASFEAQTGSGKMECDLSSEDEIEVGDINYIGDRHAVLYSLDDITDVKKADLPDEFFELTVNDVRYLMEEYKRERSLMDNQPLLTKEQRERQLCQKFSGYSQTVIRIYFPEKLVLQAVFMITDTVQTVCEFVRNYLQNKAISFYLYTTPPKEKLVYTKTLLECMLVPAAVVHFGSDIQFPSYLNTGLYKNKSDPRAAALAAAQSRMENGSNTEIDISSPSTTASIPLESSLTTTNPLNESQNLHSLPSKPKAVPKWLKLSKK